MFQLRRKQLRAGWLSLTVLLVTLYVYQIFPHEHCEPEQTHHHSEHHDTPSPHAHHPHHDDRDLTDETDQPWPSHHHDLAQHVDSPLLRTSPKEVDHKPAPVVAAERLLPESEDDSNQTNWADDETGVADTIPILPLDSRGPPASC